MSELIQRTLAFLVLAGCLSGLIWVATEKSDLVTTERVTLAGLVVLVLLVSVRGCARRV